MESHKYCQIYNLEDTIGDYIFEADVVLYEQKDVNSNILNHDYATRITSSNNDKKLKMTQLAE